MRHWAVALLCSAATSLAGCNETAVESWLEEGAAQQAGPSLLTRGPLAAALTALEERVGKDVRALSLLMYPDHAVLQARNPRNRALVEQWVYRMGTVSDPVPVELLGKGKLDDNLSPLGEVNLSALPALVDVARKKVDIPEGEVARVLVKRNLPESADVRFRVFVTSQRRDAFVEADATGKIIEEPNESP